MITKLDGKLVIQPNGQIDYSEVKCRVKAIMNLIAIADTSRVEDGTMYFAMQMVEDMLPDEAQWMGM
jgi:hypothetical protein